MAAGAVSWPHMESVLEVSHRMVIILVDQLGLAQIRRVLVLLYLLQPTMWQFQLPIAGQLRVCECIRMATALLHTTPIGGMLWFAALPTREFAEQGRQRFRRTICSVMAGLQTSLQNEVRQCSRQQQNMSPPTRQRRRQQHAHPALRPSSAPARGPSPAPSDRPSHRPAAQANLNIVLWMASQHAEHQGPCDTNRNRKQMQSRSVVSPVASVSERQALECNDCQA